MQFVHFVLSLCPNVSQSASPPFCKILTRELSCSCVTRKLWEPDLRPRAKWEQNCSANPPSTKKQTAHLGDARSQHDSRFQSADYVFCASAGLDSSDQGPWSSLYAAKRLQSLHLGRSTFEYLLPQPLRNKSNARQCIEYGIRSRLPLSLSLASTCVLSKSKRQ
jgi:hypothetical protein